MKRPMLWIFMAYIIIILLGHYIKNDIAPEVVSSEMVTLTGIVEDLSITATGRQNITFKATSAGNIKIKCLLDFGEEVVFGQQITIMGILQIPEKPTNKGAFDEWQYYRKNKIYYKMFPKVLEKGEVVKSFHVYVNQLREKLSSIYDSVLPEKEASVIKAMIIGDESDLTDYLKELYRTAGIFHILAISGLNVSLLAIAVNVLLSKLGLWRNTADIVSIIIIILYTILTGSSVSTVRAATMSIVVIMGYLLQKDNDVLSAISFAGLCLLIYEPYYLFDVGFQYSFVAVAGLVLLTDKFERFITHITMRIPIVNIIFKNPYMQKYFAVCLVGSLVTMPITAYHFYYVNPYGLFVNLIIVSSSEILLILGFLIAVFGLFSQTIAMFLATPVYFLLRSYEHICAFFNELPFAEVIVGAPSLISIVLFYLLLLSIQYGFSKVKIQKGFIYITFSMLLFNFVLETTLPKKLEMTVLDVGQGDSIFFKKGNISFVIDGGNKTALLPFMNYNGINKVDMAFVTHTDGDHILGIIELAEANRVSQIFLPIEPVGDDELYQDLQEACLNNEIEILYINTNDYIEISDDFIITCIYPSASETVSANNSSLVLKIRYREIEFLMTGDIEEEAEAKILRDGFDIKSDILKLAHHGSKTSSTPEFIDEVSPEIAVVSSGRNNTYGHPNPQVVETLEEREITLYNTAEKGAITIITDGYTKKVVTIR